MQIEQKNADQALLQNYCAIEKKQCVKWLNNSFAYFLCIHISRLMRMNDIKQHFLLNKEPTAQESDTTNVE